MLSLNNISFTLFSVLLLKANHYLSFLYIIIIKGPEPSPPWRFPSDVKRFRPSIIIKGSTFSLEKRQIENPTACK